MSRGWAIKEIGEKREGRGLIGLKRDLRGFYFWMVGGLIGCGQKKRNLEERNGSIFWFKVLV